VHNKVTRLLRW